LQALQDGAEEESTTELGKLLDKDPKEKGAFASVVYVCVLA
jgi:hypothetical protein